MKYRARPASRSGPRARLGQRPVSQPFALHAHWQRALQALQCAGRGAADWRTTYVAKDMTIIDTPLKPVPTTPLAAPGRLTLRGGKRSEQIGLRLNLTLRQIV